MLQLHPHATPSRCRAASTGEWLLVAGVVLILAATMAVWSQMTVSHLNQFADSRAASTAEGLAALWVAAYNSAEGSPAQAATAANNAAFSPTDTPSVAPERELLTVTADTPGAYTRDNGPATLPTTVTWLFSEQGGAAATSYRSTGCLPITVAGSTATSAGTARAGTFNAAAEPLPDGTCRPVAVGGPSPNTVTTDSRTGP